LKVLGKRKKKQQHKKKKKQLKRVKIDDFIGRIFNATGLMSYNFETLYLQLATTLTKPWKKTPQPTNTRRNKQTFALTPHTHLLMTLYWLRHYPKPEEMESILGISKTTINSEIKYILPKLLICLQQFPWSIHWPKQPHKYQFEGAIGAIDCITHYRWRVHPRSGEWYRGDKHGHFITSQIVCNLSGSQIYSITLAKGHNNDVGLYKLSKVKKFLRLQHYSVLGDKGYPRLHNTIIGLDPTKTALWNHQHKSLRGIVEIVIGQVHNWQVATRVFRGTPELQEIALLIVYELVNWQLKQFPLHPQIK